MQRVTSLDVVRIAAIFMIVLYHFNIYYKPMPFGGAFGSIGVSLFFILSGYTLRLSYQRKPGLKNYFTKRFTAIFPLLWLCFTFFYVLQSHILNDFNYGGDPRNLIQSYLGFDGYLKLYDFENYFVIGEWFTGAILILYLIFPLLNQLMNVDAFLGTVIMLIFYNLSILYDNSPIPLDGHVMVSAFSMWLGMLMELVETKYPLKKIWIIPLTAAAAFIYYYDDLILNIGMRLAFCVSVFMIILLLFRDLKLPGALTRSLAFLSSITFSVYLTHHYILANIMKAYQKSTDSMRPALFVVSLLIIIAVGTIFYYLSLGIIKGFSLLFKPPRKSYEPETPRITLHLKIVPEETPENGEISAESFESNEETEFRAAEVSNRVETQRVPDEVTPAEPLSRPRFKVTRLKVIHLGGPTRVLSLPAPIPKKSSVTRLKVIHLGLLEK